MDALTGFLIGCVVGFVGGAVVFTSTGREVTRAVTLPPARAAGRRVARAVR